MMGRLSGLLKFFRRGSSSATHAVTSTATVSKEWTINGVKNIQSVVKQAVPVIQSGARTAGQTVITWGNAAKVGIIGAFTWIFLNGGASQALSTTLGISPELAQLLIWVIALIVIIWLINWFINWLKYNALKGVSFRFKKFKGGYQRYSGGRRR